MHHLASALSLQTAQTAGARGAQCVLEFPLACGITVGTPVRIRGVPVGSVLAVHPSLERVEVLAEVRSRAHAAASRSSSSMPRECAAPMFCHTDVRVLSQPVTASARL